MKRTIQAVLVLYKFRLEESPAWRSLQAIAAAIPPEQFPNLLVFDNSPQPQPLLPSLVPTMYISDVANPGLAQAYNTALGLAEENGSPWLMLLDQDTVLTLGYWAELVQTLSQVPAQVGAIVPHLSEGGFLHSPTRVPRFKHVPVTSSGMLSFPVTAYNSGALLRVAALKVSGAFDRRFPLEFADHALFQGLQDAGHNVWLMHACLEHRLSTEQLGTDATVDRYRSMLQAERVFHREYGSTSDRAFYHLRRSKQALGQLLNVREKRFALLSLRAALGLLPR